MKIAGRKTTVEAWIKSGLEDLETAQALFRLKRFSGCLFFCHLTIEKILKAVYLEKNDNYPPLIHKLTRLANLAKIKLDKKTEEQLAEITTFNVEARYDIFKERLYKKATKAFTEKYLKVTRQLVAKFTN